MPFKSFSRLLAIVCVSFSAVFAHAKDVVISDIDDTLKESHVLDSWDAAANSLKTDIFFWGMPQLLKALTIANDTDVHYVSNAPSSWMGEAHRQFIVRNEFPDGELHLATFGGNESFKITTIREILKRVKPERAIMFGDNGQADISVYETIRKEFPKISFFIFVRDVYSRAAGGLAIPEPQKSFVTAGEVAAWLFDQGVLPLYQAQTLIDISVNRPGEKWTEQEKIYPGATLGFPDWYDCRDHQSNFPGSPFLSSELLAEKIEQRCRYVIDDFTFRIRQQHGLEIGAIR